MRLWIVCLILADDVVELIFEIFGDVMPAFLDGEEAGIGAGYAEGIIDLWAEFGDEDLDIFGAG